MGTGLMETLSKITFSHFSKPLHSSNGYYYGINNGKKIMDKGVLMITHLGYGDFITAS